MVIVPTHVSLRSLGLRCHCPVHLEVSDELRTGADLIPTGDWRGALARASVMLSLSSRRLLHDRFFQKVGCAGNGKISSGAELCWKARPPVNIGKGWICRSSIISIVWVGGIISILTFVSIMRTILLVMMNASILYQPTHDTRAKQPDSGNSHNSWITSTRASTLLDPLHCAARAKVCSVMTAGKRRLCCLFYTR